jgi:hypothetical protein
VDVEVAEEGPALRIAVRTGLACLGARRERKEEPEERG